MNRLEQRRGSPRSRTRLEGHIVYNNRVSRMECVVRDLSDNGARLVFAHPVKVPMEFELQIPRRKLARRAQVIWYDGPHHGVMFLDGSAAAGASPHGQDGTKPLSLRQQASGVPEILDDARRRIARLLGVAADAIRLNVEFDE
jgi:hypothetical protein